MGNIPTKAAGAHDVTDREFGELESALRGYLSVRDGVPHGDTRNEHLAALVRITTLVSAQPSGYEDQILALADPILCHPSAGIDVLARANLAVGRVYLNRLNNEDSHRACMRLGQAWAYATTLTDARRDILLIVETGTQLALAMHRLDNAAGAIDLMAKVRATINAETFADDPLQQDVEKTYADMADLLDMEQL